MATMREWWMDDFGSVHLPRHDIVDEGVDVVIKSFRDASARSLLADGFDKEGRDKDGFLDVRVAHERLFGKKPSGTPSSTIAATAAPMLRGKEVPAIFVEETRGVPLKSWTDLPGTISKKEAERLAEQREESVREAISRRALDAAMAFTERLKNGAPIAEVHFGFSSMYDAISPFLTPDMSKTMAEFMREFEKLLRDADHAEVLAAHHPIPPSAPSRDDAW